MNVPEPTARRAEWGLLLIFAILSFGIVMGGAFYYRHYEQHFRAEAGRQLSAIAELKADELAQYRKERLWDAGTFSRTRLFPVWCGAFSITRKTPKRCRSFRSGRPNTW